jgi:hypothetical protein
MMMMMRVRRRMRKVAGGWKVGKGVWAVKDRLTGGGEV